MDRYIRTIGLTGSYYSREYETKKNHKNRIREISKDTVKKFFVDGNAEVLIVFEESGKELLLTKDSNKEDIEKYLGKDFLF